MKNTLACFLHKIRGGVSLGPLLALLFGLALPPARAVDVLTHMNDQLRSGENTNETILTPSNVNQSQFGQVWDYSVNGSTYAQPLYVSGVSIGGGTHNVVYIVTMEDDVYAFDADSNILYWHVSFVGGTITACPIVAIDGTDTANIVGDVGIESTPYIDKASGTMYLLARTMNTSPTNFIQTLHALNISTGAEKFGGPTVISTSGFNSQIQNQRMGLAKAGNNIIIAWASHEDKFAYHGWVMAYNATNMTQVKVFNDTPSGTLGGIWQQGRAPAVDASGNVYMITGNGTWDGTSNFGETMLKLSSSLSVLDWFTPDNYATLTANDEDFGSAGAMLIPGSSLVIGGGKDGILRVCNTGSMGHEQSGNGQIVQSISGFSKEMHAGPVYWNSSANGQLIFNCGNGDNIKSYKFNGSTFGTSAFQTSSASSGGDPGGFLSVSANGNANGILWAAMEITDSDQGTAPGIVRAYNADSINGTELWDSNQKSNRDKLGTFVKDANPLVANGRVYVGSYDGNVHVYGLLNSINIILANYSFETNSSGGAASPPKTTSGFGSLAGWLNAGSTYNNSGVDYAGDAGNIAEDGNVLAYCETGDPGAYQISGYQMQTGVPVTLTWWAKASAGAAGQTVSLMSAASPTTAFSSLTTLTNSTATLYQTGNGGAYTQYSLNYTPTSADAGNYLAVFFAASATPASAWTTFDNFALTAQGSSVTNGIYNIVNLNSGLVVDVKHGNTTNGSPVQQYAANGGANQQWGVTNVGGGIYKIIGIQSGLALDVVGGGTANGTLIDIWPYNSTYLNQQWSFTPTSGGYYRLTPGNATGSGLDVQHSGTTNGTPLEIWTYGGGSSQQWKFQTP
jgi:hypothetical protein